MATTQNEKDDVQDLEGVVFPSYEPWMASEQSRAAVRQATLACWAATRLPVADSQTWLLSELGKIEKDMPGPLTPMIAKRASKVGLLSAYWIREGGSVEDFASQMSHALDSARSVQDVLLSGVPSNLYPNGDDWMAQTAAWSHAIARGPFLGVAPAKEVFWRELTDEGKAVFGGPRSDCHRAWSQGAMGEDASKALGLPSQKMAHEFISRAYFMLGDVVPADNTLSPSVLEDAKAIVFPEAEGWSKNAEAQKITEKLMRVFAYAFEMKKSGVGAGPGEQANVAATDFINSACDCLHEQFTTVHGVNQNGWAEEALTTARTMLPEVLVWMNEGGSLQNFKKAQDKALKDVTLRAHDILPRLISSDQIEATSFEKCSRWTIEQTARAQALQAGPLKDKSTSDIVWELMNGEAPPADDADKKEFMAALGGKPGFQGAKTSTVIALRGIALWNLSGWKVQGSWSKAKQAAHEAFVAVEKLMVNTLNDMTGNMFPLEKSSRSSSDPTPEVVADRIKKRFGFDSVMVDGMDGPAPTMKSLLSAEAALEEAALRLGVMDVELGRKGSASLTLSAKEAKSRGAGGYCDTATGNMTLAIPVNVSTIVHEWVHSVDGLAGRAMGASSMASEAVQNSSTMHPAALAIRDMEAAIRGGEGFDSQRASDEEARLGRLCAAQVAIRVLGRERWATLGRAERDGYLDEAQQAGFGIVTSQAQAILKSQEDMALAPKNKLAEAKRSAGDIWAQGLELVAQNAFKHGTGGRLGAASLSLAKIITQHWGVDQESGIKAAVEQANAEGLGLGVQALRTGIPMYDQAGIAKIMPKHETAFDAACEVMNAIFVDRPSSDLAEATSTFKPGYYRLPWEVLARSAERFTAGSFDEHLGRAIRMALSPTTKADAERFKKGWQNLLSIAGIEQRPGGMRLTGSRSLSALDACIAGLGAPLRVALKAGLVMANKLEQRRIASRLSRPMKQSNVAIDKKAAL